MGNGYAISIKKVADSISVTKIQASTKTVKTSAGKSGIKLSWKKSAGYAVDYYAVFRSTKKSSGYSEVLEKLKVKRTIRNGQTTVAEKCNNRLAKFIRNRISTL